MITFMRAAGAPLGQAVVAPVWGEERVLGVTAWDCRQAMGEAAGAVTLSAFSKPLPSSHCG